MARHGRTQGDPTELARTAPDDSRIIYRFNDIVVDVAASRVTRAGVDAPLRLKAWAVLLHLLRNRHRVVTKDELRDAAWGDVVVDDDAVVQCVVELRKALGDGARNPRYVRTVPKVGYRFTAEVEVGPAAPPVPAPSSTVLIEEVSSVEIEVTEDSGDASESPAIPVRALPPAPWARRFLPLLLLAAAAGALGTYLWLREPPVATALAGVPGKKSVAVLLFENQSADRELDWLREGLADMLVADLSGSGKLSVLSRQQLHVLLSSTGGNGGEPLPLETAVAIARGARAETFLLGSFTRLGERVRLQVQLHDGASGALLAAESATAERPELIFGQVDRLAGKLLVHLGAAQPGAWPSPGIAMARTSSLAAYRLYAQALERADAFRTVEAIELLKRAIETDPDFAMAHARIGYVYVFVWGKAEEAKPYLERAFRLSDRLTDPERLTIQAWYALACGDFERAIAAMRKLVALDPRDSEAAVRLSRVLRGERRPAEAAAVLESAIVSDPEAIALHNALAGVYGDLGRHDQSIASARRYLALAPREANAHDTLVFVLAWAGRYQEALPAYRTAIELDPHFEIAHVHLGNALFQLGRHREAIAAFRDYLRLAPSDAERARAYESLTYVHYRRGELDDAWEAALQKMRVEDPPAAGPEVLVAWARGERALAERLARERPVEGLRLGRGNRLTRRPELANLGALALLQGRTEDALVTLRRALADGPSTYLVDSYETCLAEALIALKRWDEAVAECERLVALHPNDPLPLYRLGVALEGRGERGRAREALSRFLEMWKDADADVPELVDARKRLGQPG